MSDTTTNWIIWSVLVLLYHNNFSFIKQRNVIHFSVCSKCKVVERPKKKSVPVITAINNRSFTVFFLLSNG